MTKLQGPAWDPILPWLVAFPAWFGVVAALTGVPLVVGQLAGPAFSQLSERGVLSALLVGTLLAGTVLALAQAAWRSEWLLANEVGCRVARTGGWVGSAVLLALMQAFAAVWTMAALQVVGLSPQWAWPLVLLLPLAVAALRSSRRLIPYLVALTALLWAVLLLTFPWWHQTGFAPGAALSQSFAVLGPGARAVSYPPHLLRAIYGHRWWDIVALAGAGTLLLGPWLVATGSLRGASQKPRRRVRDLWPIGLMVAATWALMALGTQQAAGLNPLLAGLMTPEPTWLRWLILVAWTTGVTAAFGTAWAAVTARQPTFRYRIAAALLPTAAAGVAAVRLLAPLLHPTPLPSGAITPLLVNAEAGLLVTAYLVAPAAGVLAVIGVWSLHGRQRGAPAARIWAAWTIGLAVSLAGLHGFDRWAVGPLLHRVLWWLPARYGLGFFWLTPTAGPPDWGLAAGVAVSAALTAVSAAGPHRPLGPEGLNRPGGQDDYAWKPPSPVPWARQTDSDVGCGAFPGTQPGQLVSRCFWMPSWPPRRRRGPLSVKPSTRDWLTPPTVSFMRDSQGGRWPRHQIHTAKGADQAHTVPGGERRL